MRFILQIFSSFRLVIVKEPVWLFNSYLWYIPLTWRTSQEHSGMVWLRDKEQTFELPEPLNTSSSDWIKMNLNETAYVRVNYAPSNWRALANALQRQHTVKIWLFVLVRCVKPFATGPVAPTDYDKKLRERGQNSASVTASFDKILRSQLNRITNALYN